ncbi:hypothetical protein V1506DRAFT_523564 [Lipomyces tetrasporus]
MATLPDACTHLAVHGHRRTIHLPSPLRLKDEIDELLLIASRGLPSLLRQECSEFRGTEWRALRAYYGNRCDLGATQGGITDAIAAGSLVSELFPLFLVTVMVINDNIRMSRKVAIQLGIITWRIGASLQAASNAIEMLIMGRIIAGF